MDTELEIFLDDVAVGTLLVSAGDHCTFRLPLGDVAQRCPVARTSRLRRWSGPVGMACGSWHARRVRWNDDKSRRFQALRASEAQGALTDAERMELDRLLADLDADEADELRPAMERSRARTGELAAEKTRLDSQADALSRIVAEQTQLLADATAYLQKLRDKSDALTEDYRRVMGRDLVPAR